MWVAIVAVAGLLDVFVGGVLQVEASRRALIHERRLEAAEELVAASTSLFTSMERRAREINARGIEGLTREQAVEWLEASRGSVAEAREDVRRMVALTASVEIGHMLPESEEYLCGLLNSFDDAQEMPSAQAR